MCGILAIATTAGRRLDLDDRVIIRMRDTLAHRGPDAAGLWRHGHVTLAHRRLIVIDASPQAGQPMHSADGRLALVYNGELYNDADLRAEVLRDRSGVPPFRTTSDTETLLAALEQWGTEALPRLRGMFAFALYDAREKSILVARDPLGIKPLYYWLGRARGQPLLILASEIPAILAHPDVPRRPDPVGVSTYLTTIRTVLGERTLFEGVRAVRPGQALLFDLSGDGIRVTPCHDHPRALAGMIVDNHGSPRSSRSEHQDDRGTVRAAVEDSVGRHLRSDVPICCLLSGGLDSTIIASIAQRAVGDLSTYCSGAPAQDPGLRTQDDFSVARFVASRLRTRHAEAPVTRELFGRRWEEMVHAQGVPLSTPNEVAINEVARRLRADGRIVTISGEGADELFAGYEAPMSEALAFERALAGEPDAQARDLTRLNARRARFLLDSNAWVPTDAKSALLAPQVWKTLEADHALIDAYEREFSGAWDDGPNDDPLQAHLRFHRRVNLVGLLQRLDTATMLAGVEGRTPFADIEVAALAESLPMHLKFPYQTNRVYPPWRARQQAANTRGPHASPVITKRILRDAFPDLPPEVLTRPKASFPLPFQDWLPDHAAALHTSSFIRDWFNPAAIAAVAADPARRWQAAWPLINLALWAHRWWR